jgi:hypothetical protein
VVTGDGLALWLVITGSAVGTGLVLWLLKLLVDHDSSSADNAPADTAQDEEPRLTWVLAWPTTGEPLHPLPARPACQPALHAHTPTGAGEPLQITALQQSSARHAKRTNS